MPHKTGDSLPYIGNDIDVLEAPGKTVVVSIFSANHFGSGERLEGAIGRVAAQVAAYSSNRSLAYSSSSVKWKCSGSSPWADRTS